MKEKMLKELKDTFLPEFLNRLDEIIVFQELKKEHFYRIVEIILEELRQRLRSHRMKLEITGRVKERLVRENLSSGAGARQLRLALQ